jgi:hypothetical protein
MNPLLLLAFALIPAPSPPEGLTFEDAVAIKAAPAPLGCGIVMSWGTIDFTHKGETVRIYDMCAAGEDLPREGARCTVTFHAGRIEGVTADQRQTPFIGNILDAMRCDPPAEAAHHDYRGATVTGYGPLPEKNGDTGVWVRAVQVVTAEGGARELYFIQGFWDDKGVPIAHLDKQRRPYPAIGATCDFSTSASVRYRAAVPDPGPAELIYQIRC